jgi:hypothetical protein
VGLLPGAALTIGNPIPAVIPADPTPALVYPVQGASGDQQLQTLRVTAPANDELSFDSDLLLPVRGPKGTYQFTATVAHRGSIAAAMLLVLVNGVASGLLEVNTATAAQGQVATLTTPPMALTLPGGFNVIRLRGKSGSASFQQFELRR